MKRFTFIFLLGFIFLSACGSEEATLDPGDNGSNPGNNGNNPNPVETINTEKLVGTPLEGRTTGDDIPFDFFQCNQYKTESITQFPIKIFTAFFTPSEEEAIAEGVEIANQGMGFTAYELTDEWSNDARLIYRVELIADDNHNISNEPVGFTISTFYAFEGKSFAALQNSDWSIEIENGWVVAYRVAHELGHATGIRSHALIDYENDLIIDFNDANSIMTTPHGTDLADYNFMMQKQGEIMQNHLGEVGQISIGSIDTCDSISSVLPPL